MSDQPPGPPPTPPTEPTPPTQATPSIPPPPASWQGVQPVVERPTEAIPPVPPAAPPPAPPTGGFGPGPAAGGGGSGSGKVIAIVVVVLAILGVGAFLLLSGGDDDDDVATEQDDDEDDETTTTEEEDETTTTTEEEEETTTTTEAETTTTTGVVETTAPPGGLTFTGITDDSGQLVVEVPDTWTDVDGTPLGDGAPNVQASTDLAAFRQLTASGLSYTLLNQPNADPDATLDFLTAGQVGGCEVQPRQDYSDPVFTGRRQDLTNCNGQGITLIVIVASNAAGQSVEVSTIIVPPDPVDEIEQRIIDTFNIN